MLKSDVIVAIGGPFCKHGLLYVQAHSSLSGRLTVEL